MSGERGHGWQKYVGEFEKHLREVDPLAQVVLKGHLIIERVLDNIFVQLMYHPEHIEAARLSFFQKVHLARTFALRKDKLPSWDLIIAINELRNAIAHNLTDQKRTWKMRHLRELYLAAAMPEIAEQYGKSEDQVIAMFACAESVGFLGSFERDLEGLRGHLDRLDAVTNPQQERVLVQKS